MTAQSNEPDDLITPGKTELNVPEFKVPQIKRSEKEEEVEEEPEVKGPAMDLKAEPKPPPTRKRVLSPEVASHIMKGKRLVRRRKYEPAIKEFDAAIAKDDKAVDAYLQKGLALIKMSRNEEAVDSLYKAVELEEGMSSAYMGLGHAYSKLYRFDLAAANYSKVRRLEPDNLKALINTVGATLKAGDYGKAKSLAEELIKQNPYSPANHLSLARAYIGLKNFKAAQASIGKTIEIKKDHAEAKLVKAELLLASEKYKQAIEAADKAAKALPGSQQPRMVKARALFNMGNLEASLNELNALRKENPKSPEAHYWAAIILMAKKDPSAKDAFLDVSKTCGLNPQMLKESARAMLKLKDPAKALEIAERAIADRYEDPELHVIASKALKALGRDEDSRTELNKAKELRGETPIN